MNVPNYVEWIIVYDTTDGQPTLKTNTGIPYFCAGGISGNPQRNYGVSKATGDYIYFLDDDNILHPNMLSTVTPFLTGDNIVVFNQVTFHGALRLKARNTIQGIEHVDTAQFIFPKKYFIPWVENNYCADGIFFTQLYDRYKDNFLFLDKDLCFYNYLRH